MTPENIQPVRSNRDAFSAWLQINQIKKPVPNLIIMAIDEVSEYAVKHNLFKEFCPKMVESASIILDEMLTDD